METFSCWIRLFRDTRIIVCPTRITCVSLFYFFQDYATAFEEYQELSSTVITDLLDFYNGVTEYLQNQAITIEADWNYLTQEGLAIPDVRVPDAQGILTDFTTVLTATEIWNKTQQAYSDFADTFLGAEKNISAIAAAWDEIVAQLLLDDYDPPRYANTSSHAESDTHLQSTLSGYLTRAAEFSTLASSLLDSLSPHAVNITFPESLSLNHTFNVEDPPTFVLSPVSYRSAPFASNAVEFESWTIPASAVGALLVAVDYFFRCSSSVRLLIRFWGRAGIGLPDADLRADKPVLGGRGFVAICRTLIWRVITHPVTGVLVLAGVMGFLVYNVFLLYMPIYSDYRAGCVERTENGSVFAQNVYSIAYNYAAENGDRAAWSYQVTGVVYD